MNIIVTDHADVTDFNLDESKVSLANNIIANVYPLFDDVYTGKVSQLKKLKTLYNVRKTKVLKNKQNLEMMMKQYDQKKKVSKLLTRLENGMRRGREKKMMMFPSFSDKL